MKDPNAGSRLVLRDFFSRFDSWIPHVKDKDKDKENKMGLRQKVEQELANAQRRLQIVNTLPEDTFSFNTIIVIAGSTFKNYFVKVGEETWEPLKNSFGSAVPLDLATLLFNYKEGNLGYFEVYVLQAQETPIYASS